MQKIQLYIEGERVDLFKDESVTITQSIKNVSDIDKIFTAFSRTFSLPASKINNQIFKHYYNYDITNGFDARIRKTANIELNDLAFNDGLIKLEGVDLKNNLPHTYRITFFGSTATLKEVLGDDTLSGLTSLTNLNRTYDAASVKNGLQDDPTTNDIVVPLITHTERLIYDSGRPNVAGNLAPISGDFTGVLYSELKYAIRVHSIIQAIEDKYPSISFSDDFFNTTNQPYYGLFMWLSRKLGDVLTTSDLPDKFITGFPNGIDADTNSTMQNNVLSLSFVPTPNETGGPQGYASIYITSRSNTTNLYRISIQRNGVEVANSGDITFGGAINTVVGFNNVTASASYTVYVESEFDINFGFIEFSVIRSPPFVFLPIASYRITNFIYRPSIEFDITQQIPSMTVVDFLSGIFRFFNLVAFIERNKTEIVVKTLDDFYDNPTPESPYDITKYIDVSNSQVNTVLPYRRINLQHEDTKSFLAEKHTQLFGQTWGKAEYDAGDNLDGSIYNIKTPFAQMKYERLIDADTAVNTTVQWGWMVDDNSEPMLGLPLMFYPIRITSGSQISFLNTATSATFITTYVIPSNSVALDSTVSSFNMNFSFEQNEWGAIENPADTGFTNTLFEAYYKNYITSGFDQSNRLTKISAYLPLRILLNYSLADRLIIHDRQFKINSITTNFKTGKSDIELLNDIL